MLRYSRDPKWLVLILAGMGTFMATLDVGIVTVALPTLTKAFRITPGTSQWFALAYTFAITVLLLTFGKIGDLAGRKRVYAGGILVFAAGSLVCGISLSAPMLIIARAFQGVGSAITMSAGPALVTEAFPATERGKALGFTGMAVALGLLSGPLIGGAIVQCANWRWMFFINVPVGLILATLLLTQVKGFDTKRDGNLDLTGALLMALGLGSLLIGLTFGGKLGWSSSVVIGNFIASVVLVTAFIAVEKRVKHPVLDLELFRNREFAVGAAAGWTNYASMMPVTVFTPFYLQNILSYSPMKVGATLAFGPITLAVMAPVAGCLSDRIGYRVLTSTGLLISALGIYSMRLLGPASAWGDVVWRLALTSFGSALFTSPNSSSIMGSVAKRDLGIASGVVALMRNLGMVSGVAIAGAIITSISPQFTLHGLHSAFLASAIIGLGGAALSTIRVGTNPSKPES
ncbi:MFS transporter [bacterium]|nr:MFS transporter [bacterium]